MASTLGVFILTFLCGAAYECACVFWVHHTEGGRALRAVPWSMFAALVTAIGVEGFLTRRVFIIAYVLGFGAGTYLAVKIKQRLKESYARGS